jgi:hypothetical protein
MTQTSTQMKSDEDRNCDSIDPNTALIDSRFHLRWNLRHQRAIA